MVELAADFIDLLACLNHREVRYLVVGGYALNAHGVVRATEDMDVFVAPDDDNLRLVLDALHDFGLPPGLTIDAFPRAVTENSAPNRRFKVDFRAE